VWQPAVPDHSPPAPAGTRSLVRPRPGCSIDGGRRRPSWMCGEVAQPAPRPLGARHLRPATQLVPPWRGPDNPPTRDKPGWLGPSRLRESWCRDSPEQAPNRRMHDLIGRCGRSADRSARSAAPLFAGQLSAGQAEAGRPPGQGPWPTPVLAALDIPGSPSTPAARALRLRPPQPTRFDLSQVDHKPPPEGPAQRRG